MVAIGVDVGNIRFGAFALQREAEGFVRREPLRNVEFQYEGTSLLMNQATFNSPIEFRNISPPQRLAEESNGAYARLGIALLLAPATAMYAVLHGAVIGLFGSIAHMHATMLRAGPGVGPQVVLFIPGVVVGLMTVLPLAVYGVFLSIKAAAEVMDTFVITGEIFNTPYRLCRNKMVATLSPDALYCYIMGNLPPDARATLEAVITQTPHGKQSLHNLVSAM